MNNVLVTGANGQLGSELQVLSKDDANAAFFFTDVDDLDITDYQALKNYLTRNKISTLINCAAYTAVDAAEEQQGLANAINHLAVANIATLCKKLEIKLIHISTDYIFDGTNHKPYLETDTPNPESVYGATKLKGEVAIMNANLENSVIIRTSWVYSSFGNNFVKTMLRLSNERTELGIVFDQIGTPTYARHLAKTLLSIMPEIENKQTEIYNFSNEGVCSWYDFASAIFELKPKQIKINPIETMAYPTPAKRPFYSVLNKEKIKAKFNLEIPYWKEGLKECLSKLK